jgi:hypothetical protein
VGCKLFVLTHATLGLRKRASAVRVLKPVCSESQPSKLVLQRIPDRDRIAGHARAGKLKVVVDQIQVRFGTEKDGAGDVETNAAAKVSQKMVAALEIGAADETAGYKWRIEAEALAADPRLELGLRVLAQRRRPHGVEVVEDGPVGREENVRVLVGPPGNLAADPEILFEEEKISAEGRITAAADGLRSVAGRGVGCRGPSDRSVAEGHVKLLRAGNVRDDKEHAKGHNKQQ